MQASSTRRTALVTGASSGIGRAFARRYALAGYDVVLTARRTERLQALADELQSANPVAAHVIPADLAIADAPAALFAQIEARGLHIDALVNNAGFGVAGRFDDAPWPRQHDLLQVLVVAVCQLTHLALPAMKARGFGRIINVASLAGFAPATVGATLYAPAKAFVIRFSQSLALETHGTGVHVTALCPGFTRTEFHDHGAVRKDISRRPSLMWMSAEKVAAQGFHAVERGDTLYVNGWINRLIASVGKHAPHPLGPQICRALMKP